MHLIKKTKTLQIISALSLYLLATNTATDIKSCNTSNK